MSVSNELSSEVAAALLEMNGAVNARDLKDVLSLFRTTLRALSADERARRRARLTLEHSPLPAPIPNAARGAN